MRASMKSLLPLRHGSTCGTPTDHAMGDGEVIREFRPVVIDDAWPWYESSPARDESLRAQCEDLGCRYLNGVEVANLVDDLLRRTLHEGDVVAVPLMSGALVLKAVEQLREDMAIEVVATPLSKHPFVTLSADPVSDLRSTCLMYERLSVSFMKAKVRALSAQQPRRMVLLDSSSATGSDACLFFDRVASWGWRTAEPVFVSLVEAVGAEDHYAPGPSREPKVRRPDAAALTSVAFDVIYTSHLRFLSKSLVQQSQCAEDLRAEFPRLTSYWDDDAGDTADVGRRLANTRAKSAHRTHVRTARSTMGIADRLASALIDIEERLPLYITDRAWAVRRAVLETTRAR